MSDQEMPELEIWSENKELLPIKENIDFDIECKLNNLRFLICLVISEIEVDSNYFSEEIREQSEEIKEQSEEIEEQSEEIEEQSEEIEEQSEEIEEQSEEIKEQSEEIKEQSEEIDEESEVGK